MSELWIDLLKNYLVKFVVGAKKDDRLIYWNISVIGGVSLDVEIISE